MASHFQLATRPRSLANVLSDLHDARRDWEDANAAAQREPDSADDVGDRMSEADTRIDDLREEFADRFLAATGLTWKQIEAAVQECVL